MKKLNVRKFSRSIFPLLLPTMMIAALLQVPTTAFAIASRCTVITSVSLAGGEGGHVNATNALTAAFSGTSPTSCTPNTPIYVWRYSDSSSMTSPTVVGTNSASFTPTDGAGGSLDLVGKYVQLTFTYKPNTNTTITLASSATVVWPANVVVPYMDPDNPVNFTYSGSTLSAAGVGVGGFPGPVESYRWWSCTDNSDELFNALRITETTISVGANSCNVVSGATGASYTVTGRTTGNVVGRETGRYFFPEVTETNAYGSVTAFGISLPAVTTPTFTGTSWEGQTLTRDNATATGYPAPVITYSWQTTSNGTDWTEVGTGLTYKVKATDRSYAAQMKIRLVATATTGSLSDSKSSDESNTYTYPNANGGSVTAPSPAAPGTYTPGKYEVGQTVVGYAWAVMGTPWPTLNYQWYVCNLPANTATPAASCTAASGAGNSGTASHAGGISASDLGNYDFSYVVTEQAAEKYLTFTATLTNAATAAISTPYAFTQSRIQQSGVINTAPAISGPPNITGIPSVGKKLTAATVTYTGTTAGKITYQWQRCTGAASGCSDIANAKSTTYTPINDDLAKYLQVVATATNGAGSTVTSTSASSVQINPAYAIPSGASVSLDSPSSTKGATLSANITGTTGYPASYTYTYQWQRCTAVATGCTNISGATSATYVTTRFDSTRYIRLGIRATNSAGTSSWVYSSNSAGPIVN